MQKDEDTLKGRTLHSERNRECEMVNTDALCLVKVRNSQHELTFEPIKYEDILSQVH